MVDEKTFFCSSGYWEEENGGGIDAARSEISKQC
jgi:hypothetical protein